LTELASCWINISVILNDWQEDKQVGREIKCVTLQTWCQCHLRNNRFFFRTLQITWRIGCDSRPGRRAALL